MQAIMKSLIILIASTFIMISTAHKILTNARYLESYHLHIIKPITPAMSIATLPMDLKAEEVAAGGFAATAVGVATVKVAVDTLKLLPGSNTAILAVVAAVKAAVNVVLAAPVVAAPTSVVSVVESA
jgi:hypothetical protein